MSTDTHAAHPDRGAWIQTFHGGRFYPFDPRADEVNATDIAHALSNICRFTGHCSRMYSVADHSCAVAGLCATEDPQTQLYALLHDASEAYLCDLPRPLKHHGEFGRLYREAEARVMDVVLERFGVKTTPEMLAVVKYADDVMLATEARDLMPQREVDAWAWMPPPRELLVVPMSPEVAAYEFCWRFADLMNLTHSA